MCGFFFSESLPKAVRKRRRGRFAAPFPQATPRPLCRALSRPPMVPFVRVLLLLLSGRPLRPLREPSEPPPLESRLPLSWQPPSQLAARLSSFARPDRPPVGACYEHTLWLPMLGTQTIRLTVETARTMRLLLQGVISLDDTVAYGSGAAAGKLDITFSAPTKRMLRRFGTSFHGADYVSQGDRATFLVKPPLSWRSVEVVLSRQN